MKSIEEKDSLMRRAATGAAWGLVLPSIPAWLGAFIAMGLGNTTLDRVSLKPFIPGVFMAPVFAVSLSTGCVFGAMLGYTLGGFAWIYNHAFIADDFERLGADLSNNVGQLVWIFLVCSLGCLLGAVCETVGRRIWQRKAYKDDGKEVR